jgi:hypothetical protein
MVAEFVVEVAFDGVAAEERAKAEWNGVEPMSEAHDSPYS